VVLTPVRRRTALIVTGLVGFNLAVMSGQYLAMREDNQCDVAARGLAVWNEAKREWITVYEPRRAVASDSPPCTPTESLSCDDLREADDSGVGLNRRSAFVDRTEIEGCLAGEG